MTPEGKVKKEVRAALCAAPNTWFFMPVSMGFGRMGIPDFIGSSRGRFFAVETKAAGKKPTRLQEITINDIRLTHGEVFVVVGLNSPELDRLFQWLKQDSAA